MMGAADSKPCSLPVLCSLPSITCRTLYGFGEINSLEQYTTRIKKPVKQDALQVSTCCCLIMPECHTDTVNT